MAEHSQDAPGLARIDFSEADEARMGRLAWAMGFVGLVQAVLGGLGVVLALLFAVEMLGRLGGASLPGLLLVALMLVVTVLPVYQGIVLREAGESIGRVARTDDDDQEHLAAAFRRLRVVFAIEAALALLLAARMFL
jgi:heme A synthase